MSLNVTELVETLETVGMSVAVIDETPSPFLPDSMIQYAWDATSLEYYKRCPQLYKYLMIDGWHPKKENVNLRWGAEMHQAFAEYEIFRADEKDHEESLFYVIRNLLTRCKDWNPDHKYKNKAFLVRSVIKYLDKHVDDNYKTVMLANGKPAVEVSFRFELDHGPIEGQPYVLCGHLDRIVEFNDEIFFKDYKSTTTTPSDYYWAQFHPHNQMSLYVIACKVIFQTKIKGGIIESAQIMIDDTRFTQGMTYRTEEELEEWLEDLSSWLDRAKHSAEYNDWPKNDTACDKYGGCMFRDICSKSPSVRERFLKSEFVKGEPWNPLVPR